MTLVIAAQPAPPAIAADQPDALRGRAILDGALLQYADAIEPGDLVAVNFDIKSASAAGGLHVVESIERGAVAWQGVRRIERTATGLRIDESGRGKWVAVTSLDGLLLRIVGVVEQVLRPTVLAPLH